MKKIFAAVFGLLFFIYSNVCSAYAPTGKCFVTMLDVGQGDAFLIETPYQNILLDSGDVNSRNNLVAQIKNAGVTRFERIILTHPHADHIGGVDAVLKNFPVDEITDNGYYSVSPLFTAYRKADVKFSTVRAGDVIDLGGGVKFRVLWPNRLVEAANVNDQSIVGKLTFGDFAMLFTGDIESAAEEFLIDSDLHANILKVAHHGSKTSSTPDFIAAVNPDFVFISAGKDNSFGHPHKITLETLRQNFILSEKIFCTAFNGSVCVETDGHNYTVAPEFNSDWIDNYIGAIITITRLD